MTVRLFTVASALALAVACNAESTTDPNPSSANADDSTDTAAGETDATDGTTTDDTSAPEPEADTAVAEPDTATPEEPVVIEPQAHEAGRLDHVVVDIHGDQVDLSAYRGQVMLVVNVASACGFTPQYGGLQTLYETYNEQGLEILGFPCNQFGSQEPGSSAEIAEFCSGEYGVTFDMFEKVDVNGPDRSALYTTLTTESDAPYQGDIRWNFTKFLVDREGYVIARFDSAIDPQSQPVIEAIEAALAAE